MKFVLYRGRLHVFQLDLAILSMLFQVIIVLLVLILIQSVLTNVLLEETALSAKVILIYYGEKLLFEDFMTFSYIPVWFLQTFTWVLLNGWNWFFTIYLIIGDDKGIIAIWNYQGSSLVLWTPIQSQVNALKLAPNQPDILAIG